MSNSCDSMDYACQAPLFMGFSRQVYWSGLPFPSPGDFPDPGIEPRSPALQELWGKSKVLYYSCLIVSSEGTQDGCRICLPSSSQPLQPPPAPTICPLRGLGMRHRILAPDRWGVHQRKDFSKPRLPIHTKMLNSLRYLIAVVQLLSCVQCFVTPWTVAHQASLFFPNSQSLLKLISTELVMLSNHFILCRYLVFLWDI